MSTLAKPTSHLDRLDVLRGLAILAVFLFHYVLEFYPQASYPWQGIFLDPHAFRGTNLLVFPFLQGYLGVPLFFIISGFVIHWGTLQRGKNFSFKEFFSRRFFRIWPPYILIVGILTICYFYAERNSREALRQFLYHALFLHNFDSKTFFGLNSSFWSLAVEAQFYLLYPVFLWLNHRAGIKRVFVYSALLSAGAGLAANYFWFQGVKDYNSVTPVPFYISSNPIFTWSQWIFGAYLAELRFKQAQLPGGFSSSPWLWLALSVVSFSCVFLKPVYLLCFSVFAGILMLRYLYDTRPLSFLERTLIPVGLCSYSLYLVHQPLLKAMVHWRFVRGMDSVLFSWFWFMAIASICGMVGWISYKLIELKSAQLSSRFLKSRQGLQNAPILTDKAVPR